LKRKDVRPKEKFAVPPFALDDKYTGLCVRAFVRLESRCYREKASRFEAKTRLFEVPSEHICRIRVSCFFQLLNPILKIKRYIYLPELTRPRFGDERRLY
jgi:hypothetical protein